MRLDTLPENQLREELHKCCASRKWVDAMVGRRPYVSRDELMASAEKIWFSLDEKDWLEAFAGHPKIGDRKATASGKPASEWSKQEQKSVTSAAEKTLEELARLNREYEEKFGFIYIVCATGKSGDEMLNLLKGRIGNSRAAELKNAAEEQNKIMKLRLDKIL